jgi:hypothetical protein
MRGRSSILVYKSQAVKGCGGVQGVLDVGMGGHAESSWLLEGLYIEDLHRHVRLFGLVGRLISPFNARYLSQTLFSSFWFWDAVSCFTWWTDAMHFYHHR